MFQNVVRTNSKFWNDVKRERQRAVFYICTQFQLLYTFSSLYNIILHTKVLEVYIDNACQLAILLVITCRRILLTSSGSERKDFNNISCGPHSTFNFINNSMAQKKSVKKPWSLEEDATLLKLIGEHGDISW